MSLFAQEMMVNHADLRDWLDDPEKSLREDIESNELPLFANMLDSKKGGQDMAPGFSGV